MDSFLRLTARDLLSRFGDEMEHLTVFMPNRRAALFLQRELGALLKGGVKAVWMPRFMTLGAYISEQVQLQKGEPIPLLTRLYAAYVQEGGLSSFDDFYYWGETLLSDFDEIDKYRVDAEGLFSNLTALQELDRNDYLTQEQIEAISRFWTHFNPDQTTAEKEAFLKFWKLLYPIYLRFRKSLLEEGWCYEGLAQRIFSDKMPALPSEERYAFVGFNALSRSEEMIFHHFKAHTGTVFYWDYDIYYVNDPAHEAGEFLRRNLTQFPSALDIGFFNNLRHDKAPIQILSIPSTVGEAKLLPELLGSIRFEEGEHREETAVVLADEQMLLPALYSIPSEIGAINVTMGYPAGKSPAITLIRLLADLQTSPRRAGGGYLYHTPVTAILSHELIRKLYPEACRSLLFDIQKRSAIFVRQAQLTPDDNPLFQAVFSPDREGVPIPFAAYVEGVISQLLKEPYVEQLTSMEREMLCFSAHSMHQLSDTLERCGIEADNSLFIRMAMQTIERITIPFTGEPLTGIQVMGLMESRMLDFRRVYLLGANELILPRGSSSNSFIPHTLRAGFGLPLPKDYDALFAYTFYRLIQRAEKVTLIYNSDMQGMNTSGEMSRFLYQLKYESGLPVEERPYLFNIDFDDPKPITIEKRTEDVEKIKQQLTEKSGLSPSALNCYLRCRLQFFFKYILKISAPQTTTDEMNPAEFGTLFHGVMERLYKRVEARAITSEDLERWMADRKDIKELVQKTYREEFEKRNADITDTGQNLLLVEVIERHVLQTLRFDLKYAPFTLLGSERHLSLELPVGDLTVKFHGYIDRVDRVGDAHRIVDYKTGGDELTFTSVESLFDRDNAKRNSAALQTLLYSAMEAKATGSPLISPCIYSINNLYDEKFDPRLKMGKESAVFTYDEVETEFLAAVKQLVEEMLSPSISFDQCENPARCQWCDYLQICRRKVNRFF